MVRVAIVAGAAVSLVLGLALSRHLERREIAGSIRRTTGSSSGYSVIATRKEMEDIAFRLRWEPPEFSQSLREGDAYRIRARVLEVPILGACMTHQQWEIRRGGETMVFGVSSSLRFWGIVGLMAAAPLGLAVLAAVAVALTSERRKVIA